MHLTKLLLIFPLLAVAQSPTPPSVEPSIVYVSPSGNDASPGTGGEPLKSVQKALSRIPLTGGTIRLLGGIYHEAVAVPAVPGGGPLLIEAAAGEKAVFDGAQDLPDHTAGKDGLVTLSAPGVVNLWDADRHFRYLKQLDEAGVRVLPGSFFILADDKVLVHLPAGAGSDRLQVNRLAAGLEISRDQTTVRGIQFENFVGEKMAAAVSIGNARQVEVSGCRIANCVRGVVIGAQARNVRVADCEILDVATGIHDSGIGLEALNDVILCASGDFAIREEADYDELNAIRFYHPAEEGTVRGCVTAGFWAGLYQKTAPAPDGLKPFLCEGNIFLDGIKTGTASQATSRYIGNVIAGGGETSKRLASLGALVQGNYFFSYGKSRVVTDAGGNETGGNPFENLADGKLTLRKGLQLPQRAASAMASLSGMKIPQVPDSLRRLLASDESAEAKFVGEPVFASSAAGAVITARFNAAAEGVLKYRAVGETAWRQVAGQTVRLAPGPNDQENLSSGDESEVKLPTDSLVFVLLDKQLEPNREFEGFIAANDGSLVSPTVRFATRGGPKTLTVSPADEGNDLQSALDRALPGDTVLLPEGVYTRPAVLVHGGTPDAPLVIQGAGQQSSILDGGRYHAIMLDLQGVRNVAVKGMQVRLFERAGISAQDCPGLIVADCRFLNKEISSNGYTKGTGILLKNCPGASVSRCVFTQLLYGIQAVDSPGLLLTHNTAFKNLFSGAQLENSALNSKITRNSFTFTGNISLYIIENDSGAFGSLVCDYNNYGTTIRKIGESAQRSYATAGVDLPKQVEASFVVPARYGTMSGSKRIIDFIPGDGQRQRFFTMDDWRKFSGKDMNSIYADPGYVDPLKGDFRVFSDSPNAKGQSEVLGALNETIKP